MTQPPFMAHPQWTSSLLRVPKSTHVATKAGTGFEVLLFKRINDHTEDSNKVMHGLRKSIQNLDKILSKVNVQVKFINPSKLI